MHVGGRKWIPIMMAGMAGTFSACQPQPNASVAHQTPVLTVPPAGASTASAGKGPSTRPARAAAAMQGADLGAAGGWLIAAAPEELGQVSGNAAAQASQRAEQHPASSADAQAAPTADLNNDGFVTMDEVLAMERAGFDDGKMIHQLQATGQVFSITDRQEQYLRDRGINQHVIDAMKAMRPSAMVTTH